MPATFKYDCLISYNHHDRALVRRFCDGLQARGVSCWIDDEQVPRGSDWRETIRTAMAESQSVLIFFGPSGPGGWQMEEWKYLSKHCVETKKRFIPICLPGGVIPDDLQLSVVNPVELDHEPAEEFQTIRKLAAELRGEIVDGDYEITIPVKKQPTAARKLQAVCCLALPLGPLPVDERLRAACDEALRLTDFRVVQCVRADDSGAYNADVVEAVTCCAVLLADCTLEPESRQPAANVTFQMGLAHALGKPIVVLSNAPLNMKALFLTQFDEIVEYDIAAWKAENPNAVGQLAEVLVERLQKCRERLRPPYLTACDRPGVGVVRADLHKLGSTLWESFHLLHCAGLRIYNDFRHVARTTHALKLSADALESDLTSIEESAHCERDGHHLRRAHAAYVETHRQHAAGPVRRFLDEAELHGRAFDRLASGAQDTCELVRRAQKFHSLLKDMLEGYGKASAPILVDSWLPATLHAQDLVQCSTQVGTLAKFAEQVQIQAFEMLMCLLELIGQEPPPEGAAHAHHS